MLVLTPQNNNKFMLFACKDRVKGSDESLIPDGYDINFKMEPLIATNLSKGEKEFNKIVKHITSIYDTNHDPFLFHLLGSQSVSIRFNKKSSSLLYRESYSKNLSVMTAQNKRKRIAMKYPHKITLLLNFKEQANIHAYITTKHYMLNTLTKTGHGTNMVDICFKTEKSLNNFIKSYIIGKIATVDRFYNNKDLKLKNSTKYKLYGIHLQKFLSKWKNVNVMHGFDSQNLIDIWTINAEQVYEDKLKEIHKWANKNLHKKFLMMGTQPEVWLFEDEDDMNFFRMKWS